MKTITAINIVFLTIALFGLGANAAQKCYQCSGFYADKKTLVFTEYMKQLERDPHVQKPIQDECLTNPSNLVTCDSYCSDVVATINMKNMGGIDFGQANNVALLEEFRTMGTVRMVIRGCVDSMLNITDKNLMKEFSKTFEMGKESACVNGNMKISGINVEGSSCICQGDACNKKQPKQTIAAGDVPHPKDVTSYARPFLAGSCSQVEFTEKKVRDLFNNIGKSEDFVKAMASVKMLFNIPPQSQLCFTQPPTKQCETLAYSIGMTEDSIGIKKMSAEKIASLNKMLKDSLKMLNISSDLKAEELGRSSMVMRGCAEDLFPMVFASGFPKIGLVSGTIEGNAMVVGVKQAFHLSICNTDKCNLQPVV